ncbi:maleylpyruvate isomerase N-terminal domain-containing protein [Nonomuraea sp. NPDC052265]|uniref:maleylpyruvate isomerase N-terminal domain-containing protein n=1 Tax=Nonomuraea sp. NPDC052265 TaxID=3364374 RepID=UPI0037C842AC
MSRSSTGRYGRSRQPRGGRPRRAARPWCRRVPGGRSPTWSSISARFAAASPDDPAWTWSREQTVGFWRRMQAIEAAVHRWDAENAIGPAAPIDAAFVPPV